MLVRFCEQNNKKKQKKKKTLTFLDPPIQLGCTFRADPLDVDPAVPQ